MILRPYQQECIEQLRNELRHGKKSVCLQLATGAGKTAIVSAITHSALAKNNIIWFVVPRNELLEQASEHFKHWDIAHNKISQNRNESLAFKVHVVSKDTLIRRYDIIKKWPSLIIFDEAHLYIDRQNEIMQKCRQHKPDAVAIGMTATPERLDGKGLSVQGGGHYEGLIRGPSIPHLSALGFISELRYFAPPRTDFDDLRRRGTEYDAKQVDEKNMKIYGEVIDHYRKHAAIKQTTLFTGAGVSYQNKYYNKGKPALIFCRTVQSAYDTAEKFRNAGFDFYCIEGNMNKTKRKSLIESLRKGEIDGLTNCEIATYGLDVPRLEYGACIRPTLSRALYMQMVGRILRPYEMRDERGIVVYKKEDAIFCDHANLIKNHSCDITGVPLFYADNIEWNFDGRKINKRENIEGIEPYLCPHNDFQYCTKKGPACKTCEYFNKELAAELERKQKEEEIVNVNLKEIDKIPLSKMPEADRREYVDRINSLKEEYKKSKSDGIINNAAVQSMIDIQNELGYKNLWVYHQLSEGRVNVDASLLHAICNIYGYKPGWVFFKKKELEQRIKK